MCSIQITRLSSCLSICCHYAKYRGICFIYHRGICCQWQYILITMTTCHRAKYVLSSVGQKAASVHLYTQTSNATPIRRRAIREVGVFRPNWGLSWNPSSITVVWYRGIQGVPSIGPHVIVQSANVVFLMLFFLFSLGSMAVTHMALGPEWFLVGCLRGDLFYNNYISKNIYLSIIGAYLREPPWTILRCTASYWS